MVRPHNKAGFLLTDVLLSVALLGGSLILISRLFQEAVWTMNIVEKKDHLATEAEMVWLDVQIKGRLLGSENPQTTPWTFESSGPFLEMGPVGQRDKFYVAQP